MATDSNVPITAGSGTTIDTRLLAGGDQQQVVREARGTAVGTLNVWTLSLTASTSQIAADVGRVGMLMSNTGGGRVYLRFDSTAPTATAFHWYVEPGERYEVPIVLTELPVSMLATVASGTFITALVTAA